MYNEGLFKVNCKKKLWNARKTKHICKQYVELETYTENMAFYDCIIVVKNNIVVKCCEFYNCIIKNGLSCNNFVSCSLISCDLLYNASRYNWCDIDECLISPCSNIDNSKVSKSIISCRTKDSCIIGCHITMNRIEGCYAYNNSYEDNYCIPKEIMSLNDKTYNVGYKKAKKMCHGREKFVIIKLLFDPEASGCTGGDIKHRTSRVFVADIYSVDKKTHYKDAYSGFDERFEYKKGSWVSELDTDMNSLEICSTGIHFFFNEADAIEYCL